MMGITEKSALQLPLEAWLLPLDEASACGPSLEYDPEFLELAQNAAGKPGSQFGPGSPPDWGRVRELSESLFTRTRDLRVAMYWGRALINLDGFSGLPAGLALLAGLLERFWDELHPKAVDESDDLARLSVIGSLNKLDGLLGDIRSSRLADQGPLQGLRVRDVEVALKRLTPRAGEVPRAQSEIAGMLAAAKDGAVTLGAQARAARDFLERIQAVISQRVSPHLAVDLATLRTMLECVAAMVPAPKATDVNKPESATSSPVSGSPPKQAGGVHSVETRQEAIRAIELVCTYLERSEPTNPAQLLLRRAARVIDKNFLELMRELAPDAVKDVAKVLGVDPSTVNDSN